LAVGVILGFIVADFAAGSASLRSDGGALVAQGALARTLSYRLASETLDQPKARIGLSFVAKDGQYCRTFTMQERQEAVAGIACRDDGQWRIATLAAAAAIDPNAFQPAGGALPAPVRAAAMAMMAGPPLEAEAERKARDQGWQTQK
jgi:hypothetical protein